MLNLTWLWGTDMQSNCIKVLYKDHVNYQLKTQNNFQNCFLSKVFFFQEDVSIAKQSHCTSIPHSLISIPVKNEIFHYPDYKVYARGQIKNS